MDGTESVVKAITGHGKVIDKKIIIKPRKEKCYNDSKSLWWKYKAQREPVEPVETSNVDEKPTLGWKWTTAFY